MLQRNICRKTTWGGRYLQFSTFAPSEISSNFHLRSAENLHPRSSTNWRRTVLKEHSVSQWIHGKFSPERRKIQWKPYEKRTTIEKKQAFIALSFIGGNLSNQINGTLKSVIKHAYPAAQLRLLQTTERLGCLADPNVSRLPAHSQLRDAYISKTDRCLTKRVSGHIRKGLLKSTATSSMTSYAEAKPPASSIVRHSIYLGI